jgi:hypothetical protein
MAFLVLKALKEGLATWAATGKVLLVVLYSFAVLFSHDRSSSIQRG